VLRQDEGGDDKPWKWDPKRDNRQTQAMAYTSQGQDPGGVGDAFTWRDGQAEASATSSYNSVYYNDGAGQAGARAARGCACHSLPRRRVQQHGRHAAAGGARQLHPSHAAASPPLLAVAAALLPAGRRREGDRGR
jgi:hypothetical protein